MPKHNETRKMKQLPGVVSSSPKPGSQMNASAGIHSLSPKPAKKQVIYKNKTYYIYPKYENYACSTDGYIINRKTLKPTKGRLRCNGYYDIMVSSTCLNGRKCYASHRLVFEAVNQQLIPDGMQINHKNFNKQDNSINNLELVTRKDNMIHAGRQRRGQSHSKKQNIPMKSDVFHYHYIFTSFGANKDGQIFN